MGTFKQQQHPDMQSSSVIALLSVFPKGLVWLLKAPVGISASRGRGMGLVGVSWGHRALQVPVPPSRKGFSSPQKPPALPGVLPHSMQEY